MEYSISNSISNPNPNPTPKKTKKPISVLVVLHDEQGEILLLERKDRAGFWQSVTGSLEDDETPFQTALREVWEEIGILLNPNQLIDWEKSIIYEIYPHWRHRYADGVTHNREHWFSAEIPRDSEIQLSEHTQYQWLNAIDAEKLAFSPSNRELILEVKKRFQAA